MNTWDGGKSDDLAIQQARDISIAEGIKPHDILIEPFITILPDGIGSAAPNIHPRAGRRLVRSGTQDSRTGAVVAHRARTRLLDRYSAPIVRSRVLVNETTAIPIPGAIIRHPDLLVHCDCGKCRAPIIIELDGSWHATKAGLKATDRRNRDYRYADIMFLAIPTYEYPLDTWHGHLHRWWRNHRRTNKTAKGR